MADKKRDIVQEATILANSGQLNKAIRMLEKEIEKPRSRGKTAMKNLLVQWLNARAVQNISSITEKINPILKEHQENIDKKAKSYLTGSYMWDASYLFLSWIWIFIAASLIITKNLVLKSIGISGLALTGISAFVEIVVRFFNRFSVDPRISLSVKYYCKRCGKPAQSGYNLPDQGEVYLCGKHS